MKDAGETAETKGVNIRLKRAAAFFTAMWLLTGIAYPLAVYAAAQQLFPQQAEGSLIKDKNNNTIGSELIGQYFTGPKYFQPRPSATAGRPYNPMASGGSNMGPTNKGLVEAFSDRASYWKNASNASVIPSDLVTASASGLDPHISVESAYLQAPNIAKERGIETEEINELIDKQAEKPILGIIGTNRVNILMLNKALDALEDAQ
ncbi:MAG: potassium-transporting ATPase subunit KdpC [Candidatus Altiarchaeota archaeon]|nr:potassium-transporting ATPase subunit KdpC [Candidatus Altiarchaeota archaeon]